MKICFKCKKQKSLKQYYNHKGMSDGYLNKCKSCTKEDVIKREEKLKNDPLWIESEKKRAREKYHRLYSDGRYKQPPEKKRISINRYKLKYPEKIKARNKTSNMKAKIKGNHLHHWSYRDKHLKDVIELSVMGHNYVHRMTIYDQERLMYRTLDGILLDTRDAAIRYYKEKLLVRIF